jgi:hypothetical protein
VNVAVFDPAGTVTEAGTLTFVALLLTRLTVHPPFGAAVRRVTVPIELLPPMIDAGLRLRPEMESSRTVKTADLLDWESEAVIVAV